MIVFDGFQLAAVIPPPSGLRLLHRMDGETTEYEVAALAIYMPVKGEGTSITVPVLGRLLIGVWHPHPYAYARFYDDTYYYFDESFAVISGGRNEVERWLAAQEEGVFPGGRNKRKV